MFQVQNLVCSSLKYVICSAVVLLIAGIIADATPPGFLEGRLKISSPNEVDLADAILSKTAAHDFGDYPMIVLSRDGKQEITRVTADKNGNYLVTLPPGDYILDVLSRRPKGHVRATPQPFTVVSNQTVHVDMSIDTGVR